MSRTTFSMPVYVMYRPAPKTPPRAPPATNTTASRAVEALVALGLFAVGVGFVGGMHLATRPEAEVPQGLPGW